MYMRSGSGHSDRPSSGPHGGGGGRGGARSGKPMMKKNRKPFLRRKVCRFCGDKVLYLDYKEMDAIRRYLTEKGKIIPRRTTGNCAKCQRMLVRAIKRARHAGLLPFEAASV